MQVRSQSDHSEVPRGPAAHLPFSDHCKYNHHPATLFTKHLQLGSSLYLTKTSLESLSLNKPPLSIKWCIKIQWSNPFQVCAIVGGTFTVAGIIDSCIFSGRWFSSHISLAAKHDFHSWCADLFFFSDWNLQEVWAGQTQLRREEVLLLAVCSHCNFKQFVNIAVSNFCPCN